MKLANKDYISLLIFLFVKFVWGNDLNLLTNVTNMRTKREFLGPKRYLVFPQGSNVQLVFCMTIGSYSKPQGVFTYGVTAGLAWELPHVKTVPYRKPAEVYHRRSRRDLYRKIEIMLRSQGKGGKECVLKALCQAGKRNGQEIRKGSFMEEVMYSLFTLPVGAYDEDPKTEYEIAHSASGNCDFLFPTCQGSFF